MKPRGASPIALVASLWGVTLLLSVYGASAVSDAAAKTELFGEMEWLQNLVTSVGKSADAVGVRALRNGLGNLRSRINEPFVVLEKGAEPIPDRPDAGVAVTPDAGLAPGQIQHRGPIAKKRVLVIGASSIQFAIGVQFEKRLKTYEGVSVKRFGKLATGLSRPDFFDWPKKVDQLSRRFKPDLIIANFGGNGAQDIPTDEYGKVKFGTDEWNRLYAERTKQLIAVAKKHQADVVFMGMPNMRKAAFRKKMASLNAVQKRAAEDEGMVWISTWEMASNPDGSYKKSIQYQGKRGLMRMSDGIHYKTLGAKYIVDNFMQAVERHFLFAPRDPALARPEPHGYQTPEGQAVAYTAFVPKGQGPFATIYVEPGPNWDTWPNYPHRDLQRWAQQHQKIIVVADPDAPELQADVEAHLPATEARATIKAGEPLAEAIRGAAAQLE